MLEQAEAGEDKIAQAIEEAIKAFNLKSCTVAYILFRLALRFYHRDICGR